MQMPTSQYQIELLHAQAPYRPDPTAMFNQLCGARPATLLLESAEIDKKHDLKSMMVVDSALRITALGQTVTLQALRCCRFWTPLCRSRSRSLPTPTAAS